MSKVVFPPSSTELYIDHLSSDINFCLLQIRSAFCYPEVPSFPMFSIGRRGSAEAWLQRTTGSRANAARMAKQRPCGREAAPPTHTPRRVIPAACGRAGLVDVRSNRRSGGLPDRDGAVDHPDLAGLGRPAGQQVLPDGSPRSGKTQLLEQLMRGRAARPGRGRPRPARSGRRSRWWRRPGAPRSRPAAPHLAAR